MCQLLGHPNAVITEGSYIDRHRGSTHTLDGEVIDFGQHLLVLVQDRQLRRTSKWNKNTRGVASSHIQITLESLLGLEESSLKLLHSLKSLYSRSSPISNYWHFEIDHRWPLKLIKRSPTLPLRVKDTYIWRALQGLSTETVYLRHSTNAEDTILAGRSAVRIPAQFLNLGVMKLAIFLTQYKSLYKFTIVVTRRNTYYILNVTFRS